MAWVLVSRASSSFPLSRCLAACRGPPRVFSAPLGGQRGSECPCSAPGAWGDRGPGGSLLAQGHRLSGAEARAGGSPEPSPRPGLPQPSLVQRRWPPPPRPPQRAWWEAQTRRLCRKWQPVSGHPSTSLRLVWRRLFSSEIKVSFEGTHPQEAPEARVDAVLSLGSRWAGWPIRGAQGHRRFRRAASGTVAWRFLGNRTAGPRPPLI